MVLLWLLVCFCVVDAGSSGGLFSAELRAFLDSHDVARAHVGVSFDVVTGQHTSVSLFRNPRFRLDPFVAETAVRVSEVKSLEALFEEMALELRLEYQPGMFVKAFLPHFAPEHEASPGQTTLVGHRTEAALGIVMDPSSARELSPALQAALQDLPERFDPGQAKVWSGFFERFGTHWVDEAVVGGRLQVSARVLSGADSAQVKKTND